MTEKKDDVVTDKQEILASSFDGEGIEDSEMVELKKRREMTVCKELFDRYRITIDNKDLQSGIVSSISCQMIPTYAETIDSIIRMYRQTSRRGAIATIAAQGLVLFNVRYRRLYRALCVAKDTAFHDDPEKAIRIRSREFNLYKYYTNHPIDIFAPLSEVTPKMLRTEIYKENNGVRVRTNIYGDRNKFVTPVGDYARIFRHSSSDIAHIVIAMACVTWLDNPPFITQLMKSDTDVFDQNIRLLCGKLGVDFNSNILST